MADEEKSAEQEQPVQAETTQVIKGKVKIGTGGWNNPTPTILARVTEALRYFCVAIMGSVSATDLFSGLQAKRINFGLSIFIYFLGGVDKAVGVEPAQREKVLKMLIIIWGLYAIDYIFSTFRG